MAVETHKQTVIMETKTYVFGDGSGSGNSGMWGWLANLAQNRGVDPNVLAMMNNNGGWGNGMGNWIWFFFIILLWGGNGWGGFGRNGQGTADLASLINGDNGRDLLMQAINGNGTAISQLASTLNCSVGQIQQSINGVMTQLQSLGNQVGMSGQAIINAIQSGNCSIERQLAQCCCDNRLLTTQQGYENRIRRLTSKAFSSTTSSASWSSASCRTRSTRSARRGQAFSARSRRQTRPRR